MATIFKLHHGFLIDSLRILVEGMQYNSYKNLEADFESSLLWWNGDWTKTGWIDLTKATNRFFQLQSISEKFSCSLLATVLHRRYTKIRSFVQTRKTRKDWSKTASWLLEGYRYNLQLNFYIAPYLQFTIHTELWIHRTSIQNFWNHPCLLDCAPLIWMCKL